jgi:hypothetical protein
MYAVTGREGDEGFLVTAYSADAIKAGKATCRRSR